MKSKMRIFAIIFFGITVFCSCNNSPEEPTADAEYIAYLEEHIIQMEEYAKSIEEMVSNINDELTPEVIEIPFEPVIEDEPAESASAYKRWIEAEMTASERDMYESMYEGWYIMDDEISRGWIDDGTRTFLELLKGTTTTLIDGNGTESEITIATASAGQLKQIWKTLDEYIEGTTYCINDFFMVDEDGNPTNDGIYNFFEAINQLENTHFVGEDIVTINEYNNVTGWDFGSVGDDGVAKALGVSEELVVIIQHAAIDCGFVVNFD